MTTDKKEIHLKEIDERLMELNSLFEISKLLSSNLNLPSVLNNILLTPMGRMMITKGLVLLENERNSYDVKSIKGLPHDFLGKSITIVEFPTGPVLIKELAGKGHQWADALNELKLKIIIPINSSNKNLGMLIFGDKLSGLEFSEKEIDFLVSLSNISATAISNSLMFEEIQSVNRRLDQSVQGLNTIFEIGNELNSNLDVSKILKLLGFALMGQMLVNKYAFYLAEDDMLELKEKKGLSSIEECSADFEKMNAILLSLKEPYIIDRDNKDELSSCLGEHNYNILIPMKVKDDTKGLICLGDKINKSPYSSMDIEFLTTLGNQSMVALENARLFEETIEKQKMEEELAVANEIQNNLLPKRFPEIEGLELEAVNIPSKFVGGDYFDFLKIGDDILFTVIADVSGKGVPASLLMANLQASIRALADEIEDIATLTGKVNNIIYENTAADKFITFFCSRYNYKTGLLEYCNAGHNFPLVITKDKEITNLETGGLIIGMLPNFEYSQGSIKLNPGDTVVMYTDGITEALNPEEEEFEEERLIEICLDKNNENAPVLESAIIDAVYTHADGFPQSDDITLVIMKINE